MKKYQYVTLDPTGNITCLVLEHVDPEDEKELTRRLLQECEQVAYLEPATLPDSGATVRLMGGEFCGNAAMAAAAWLMRCCLNPGEEKDVPLQVSGTEGIIRCRIKALDDGFEGTVQMPGIREVTDMTYGGIALKAVRMEGIIHLVYEGAPLEQAVAESLLKAIAATLPDEAAGLIRWNRETGEMIPLVYVRGSGSLVWEHGCGSGSAAVGALEALRQGEGTASTAITQPGGVIRVTAEAADGKIRNLSITGRISIGRKSVIEVP